ncbi:MULTISPECIES: ABC transporter ATP-binding protein [Acidiphilium]|jgi:subfamily B ATP-binding cassette protein MsbA|uniref:ABC transporter ATP-binding protein n=1 Tax=Acidiphilium TaxID=522 RepID=UPI0004615D4D|nr:MULTISPECIES: ABC transporter ATP-binding protein [Acidiphilium]KDM65212.1 lipid A export ATP-binding/permease protein MsbA [Acidiphilium sp. JA12-A1]UNC12950.1 ABC transporter ATP-binding protein [Acidiphilium multivorum]
MMETGSSIALARRLWRQHVSAYRGRVALIIVATLIMSGTTALYPALIDRAFTMFARRDPRILYQVPLIVLAVTMVKALAQYAQTLLTQQVVLGTIRRLQVSMFDHLTGAELARIDREAPAALAARFTTDATVIREAMSRAVNGIADFFTLIGLVGTMLWIDWELSLIAALLYPLAGLPIQKIGRRIRRASGGMQERMGETAALLNESFAQARTVRAYGLEEDERRRAERAFEHLYRALMRMIRGRAALDPVLEVLGGLAIALVIGFAGWRHAAGASGIGNFTGFVAALLIASRPLRALGTMNAAVQEGMAGLERVFHVIDEPSVVADRPDAVELPPGPGRVEFRHVGFAYPDGRPGLRDLSFVAEPGRTLALVGASGAGKSTALALLPRLYEADRGAILIDGADISAVSLDSLRGAIAYVGQDALLFDDTIAANIAMGRRGASIDEIRAAAEAAAAGFIADLPEGFETRVGVNGQRLSGGQRQRVALARALLRDPRILLLDEATSALDAESEAAVQQALARLRRGRTTIVVAHRLATVRDADRIVVMADGAVVESGTHEDLIAGDGAFARLVRAQALAG